MIDDCRNCGACASRCPYGLNTPKLLKEMLADYDEFTQSIRINHASFRLLCDPLPPQAVYRPEPFLNRRTAPVLFALSFIGII